MNGPLEEWPIFLNTDSEGPRFAGYAALSLQVAQQWMSYLLDLYIQHTRCKAMDEQGKFLLIVQTPQ